MSLNFPPTASQDVFSGYLASGEHVLWAGTPQRGIMFSMSDVLLIPFSLFWGGFAVFWEYHVVESGAPPMFRLFGIPFILAGLLIIAGRFLFDAWVRASVAYALTNQRILIVRGRPTKSVTALRLDRLPETTLSEFRDGRGTIRFGPAAVIFGRKAGWAPWSPSMDSRPQFVGIENARAVFDRIQGLGRSPG